MRASVYDWMRQTPEHEAYGREMYPLVHALVMNSDNFNDFARSAQGLNPVNKLQYLAQEGKWSREYGNDWKGLGCLREQHVGQRSRGRTVYGGRARGSLMGLSGIGSYFRTPSYPRNQIAGLGAVSDRPPLPEGTVVHATPPESQLQWTGQWETVPGYFTWTRRSATGPKGACRIYLKADLSDSFMAVGGGVVVMAKDDAKALQRALNEQYLVPENALVVDGIIGPKTCTALHWYQFEYKGVDSARIDPYTYMSLNLPLRFGQQYDNVCTKYYTGDYTGTLPSEGAIPELQKEKKQPEKEEPPPPPPEPEKKVSKAGIGIAVGVILGLTALGAIVFRKKGKR